MSSRRHFLKALSSAALASTVPPRLFAKEQASRIPIAFSTLGCPAWEWKKILDFAHQHGFAAIELRGLAGKHGSALESASSPRIASSKRRKKFRPPSCASPASAVPRIYTWKIQQSGQRNWPMRAASSILPSTLGAPYVRVFGGKAESRQESGSRRCHQNASRRGTARTRQIRRSHNVTVIIESHDHFTSSATLKDVLTAADSDHVGLLWDAHHTFATSNEDPEFTVKQLGPWIRHTHLKDSVGQRRRSQVRPDRTRQRADPAPDHSAALNRLQRLLLLRVGKSLASGSRRSGDRHRRLRARSRPMPGRRARLRQLSSAW